MRPVASLTVPYLAAALVITNFAAMAQTAGPPAPPPPVFYDLHLGADQVGKIINTLDRYNQVQSFFEGERATSIDVVIGELQKQVQEQNVRRTVAEQQAKTKADAEAKMKAEAEAEAKEKARDEHDRKHLVPPMPHKKIPDEPSPFAPAPDASSPPPNEPAAAPEGEQQKW